MNVREGMYEARFETLGEYGEGLVTLVNGRIFGGDPLIFYTGTYTVEGSYVRARVKADRHRLQPVLGYTSVFGRDKNVIKFEGDVDGDRIVLSGRSDNAPGIALKVTLTFLSE